MIENKVILILGQRGSGKTMTASLLSLDTTYKVIYSNYELFTPGKINKIYNSYEDILRLRYSNDKKLIIFDEGGININSRQSMTEVNIAIGKMLFISRKINSDFIFITQYKFTVDKYIRYSSDYQLQLSRSGTQFYIDVFKTIDGKEDGTYIKTLSYNFEDFLKTGIKYNTLERSIVV